MEQRDALEKLKAQIIKNITERGIDEGYNLDFILNEEEEDKEEITKEVK